MTNRSSGRVAAALRLLQLRRRSNSRAPRRSKRGGGGRFRGLWGFVGGWVFGSGSKNDWALGKFWRMGRLTIVSCLFQVLGCSPEVFPGFKTLFGRIEGHLALYVFFLKLLLDISDRHQRFLVS